MISPLIKSGAEIGSQPPPFFCLHAIAVPITFVISFLPNNQLVAFLQPHWKAVSPSNIELGGKVTNWPIVELTIGKDGKVVRTSIVSRSGNRAVDDAVTTFLANLKVVPVPPQAAVIRITLDIR